MSPRSAAVSFCAAMCTSRAATRPASAACTARSTCWVCLSISACIASSFSRSSEAPAANLASDSRSSSQATLCFSAQSATTTPSLSVTSTFRSRRALREAWSPSATLACNSVTACFASSSSCWSFCTLRAAEASTTSPALVVSCFTASSARDRRWSNATCPSLNPVRRASNSLESSSVPNLVSARRMASRRRSTPSATSSRLSTARFLLAPAIVFFRSAMLLSKSPTRSSSPRPFFCKSPACAMACLAVSATSSNRRRTSGMASSTPSRTREWRVS
mmetsp:Transcript_63277/g.145512  ORF Transcript_63277/g.145512 Transcript_63277/m.145512 type:complete len:276 (-) Transcript_63277:416-1243(-)